MSATFTDTAEIPRYARNDKLFQIVRQLARHSLEQQREADPPMAENFHAWNYNRFHEVESIAAAFP
ncbi:MAG: primase C-terminal domain-containing protein [Verrucomicrobia bacterium]|nr:primase C-terminal domain-containing protein [Verrucomicrobiota bacterium]MBU4246965.1 primase C-terminal domain-containing protein [Verrucomicrobiota bacterium]MBU4291327.1 primase C-terminal domain-containing protein [Verrucomicrobiota bacterium]MBU4430444.1 primase C-terminal domain-containing protein [Verrucomicrobiota bacterium]MBU4498096.1 primase C-terminal domain-containing protein [Verrucomicrobiota bacterium]